MEVFSTVTQVVSTIKETHGQRLIYNKSLAATAVARIPHTLWTATGSPIAGVNPSTSNTARALTSTTIGAFNLADSGASTNTFLTHFSVCATNTNWQGALILVDRIVDTNISIATVGTTTLTSFDATGRLETVGSGLYPAGCMLWCEVTSALSAASNTFTFTYTDQGGNASQTATFTNTASAAAGRSPNSNLWQPLANGDTGIRSIQSYSITGTATGNMNICLVRPLAIISIPAATQTVEMDYVSYILNMEKVFNDSCLTFIAVPVGAIATSTAVYGEVRLVDN